jgi:prepilin peptidase CpaA
VLVTLHLLLFVFPLLMVFAAAMDVFTMRIANGISIALVVLFLVLAPVAGFSLQQILTDLGIGLGVLIANMVLFHLKFVGGGDAKLLAAASVWIGYEQLVPFIACVTIFGGVLALLILAYRHVPAGALPLPGWAARLHKQGEGIPYGVAITAGALLIYPLTSIPMMLMH